MDLLGKLKPKAKSKVAPAPEPHVNRSPGFKSIPYAKTANKYKLVPHPLNLGPAMGAAGGAGGAGGVQGGGRRSRRVNRRRSRRN